MAIRTPGRTIRIATPAAALGLAALALAACGGGGSGDAMLALAFRLDGGSPALTAYAGDLQENPLALPPGPYYIEAVSPDDAIISLGEVDVGPGDKVAIAPMKDTTGGQLTDPEHAQWLRTVAGFLADVEMAQFAVLESASAGFQAPLFSAAGQQTPDLEALSAEYSRITGEEDAVLQAVLSLQSKAAVASPISYVHAGAAPSRGAFSDLLDSILPDFFNRIRKLPERERTRVLEIMDGIEPNERRQVFDSLPDNLRGRAPNFEQWQRAIESGQLDDALGAIHGHLYVEATGATQDAGHTPGATLAEEGAPLLEDGIDLALEAYGRVPHVSRAIDVTNKALEWEQYIRDIYEDPAAVAEQTLRDEFVRMLEDRIRSDLQEMAPHLSDSVIDSLAGQLSVRMVSAIPGLADGPLPPADSTEFDTAWIDELIDAISEQLLAEGESGIAVAVATDDLRECLVAAVEEGLTRDDALARCAEVFGGGETPTPTPFPDPTATPTPTPPPAQDCQIDEDGDHIISLSELFECPTPTPTPPPDGGCDLGWASGLCSRD